ncbi:MAG: hypothetical protein J6M53_01295 [Bacteroidaceae bacterium]|nr:hypothetical protein [Bacteroidaceae bacterium]
MLSPLRSCRKGNLRDFGLRRTQRGVASVYIKLLLVPHTSTAAGGEVDFPKSSAKLNVFSKPRRKILKEHKKNESHNRMIWNGLQKISLSQRKNYLGQRKFSLA